VVVPDAVVAAVATVAVPAAAVALAVPAAAVVVAAAATVAVAAVATVAVAAVATVAVAAVATVAVPVTAVAAALGVQPGGQAPKSPFSLALALTPSGASSAPATPRSPAKDAYTGPKYRVLIVDDSAMTRKMLVKTLKAAGHEVIEAEDGLQGVSRVIHNLKEASERPFDCILIDFVMPIMDGPTATKEIRALGYTAPIFGVTGNCLDFDIKRFKDCGATEVFAKPFLLETFHAAMSRGAV
jgi:CheY-like chemotaxis protein